MAWMGEPLESLSDDGLRRLIDAARKIITPVGPMHAMWDVVFDAESHLIGKPAIMSRFQAAKEMAEFVDRSGANMLKITANQPRQTFEIGQEVRITGTPTRWRVIARTGPGLYNIESEQGALLTDVPAHILERAEPPQIVAARRIG